MKKSLFCIATALMLTGCAEFLPSDDVLEVAPQSFQEYLLRQEDELQEGSSSELPDHEYDADNSSAESAVSPDTGTDTNSDSAGTGRLQLRFLLMICQIMIRYLPSTSIW